MSQKHIKILSVAIIASMALISTGVMAKSSAEQGEKSYSNKRQKRMERKFNSLMNDVDATKAQRATIKTKLLATAPQMKKVRTIQRANGKQIKNIMLSAKPDEAKIHKLINDTSTISMKSMRTMTNTLISVHGDLTVAQRATLAKQWDTPYREFKGSWFIDKGLDRMLGKLDATKAQRKVAETQKNAIVKSAGKLLKDLHPIRQNLLKQVRAKKVDNKVVYKLVDRGGVLMTQFAHDATDAMLIFTKTMTDDQRKKAQTLLSKRRR